MLLAAHHSVDEGDVERLVTLWLFFGMFSSLRDRKLASEARLVEVASVFSLLAQQALRTTITMHFRGKQYAKN